MTSGRMAAGLAASAVGLAIGGCSGLSAETGPAANKAFDTMTPIEHKECAALISAYNHAMVRGLIAMNKAQNAKTLVALGWHNNAFAIPQHVSEQDSFAMLSARREELLSSMDPAHIEQQANACIAAAEIKARQN